MEQNRQHSLCNLIMDHVPESELSEVRSIIGEALIDFYKDLCAEVSSSLVGCSPKKVCLAVFNVGLLLHLVSLQLPLVK